MYEKIKVFLMAIAGIAIILIAVTLLNSSVLPEKNNSKLEMPEVKIGNSVFMVEIANTSSMRSKGLSDREKLEEGKGMLFVFDSRSRHSFWMKDMNFPIDIIWINGDLPSEIFPNSASSSQGREGWKGKVVGFEENANPEPGKSFLELTIFNPPEPVDFVLEVPAGSVKKYGIQKSDSVEIDY